MQWSAAVSKTRRSNVNRFERGNLSYAILNILSGNDE
jgi:hypothetical protein